ncbi:MAG: hypothetical protein Kow00121_14740 [Elainellaceae cyanobacterium]
MIKALALCTSLTLISYSVASTAMAQERIERVPVAEPTPTRVQIESVPATPSDIRIAPDSGGGETAGVQHYPCSSISSCNVLISNCAEWGGTWVETGTPGPHGEPQKGTCTVNN